MSSTNYTCICPPGYSGTVCQSKFAIVIISKIIKLIKLILVVDSCFNNNCVNGGTCVPNNGSYSCLCPTDYQGYYCESCMN